jgi:serine/threonine protein kinase
MPFVKERHAEPIPGYRLLERLGSGGFGEVWKCQAPGGLFKAIKFVYGDLEGLDADGAQAEEELRAIERVKDIRHPFLLSMERVENVDGELIIVMELADRNLYDLFEECRGAGLPGVARDELLGYLREAAEVLDLLNGQYQLQHLDVKPHNLFLVSSHVKVADFGLVSSLGGGGRLHVGAITPLYASPEVFGGGISRHSDQYSLGVLFQEMLTGQLPFKGKNARQLLLQHTQSEPDLAALPGEDRPVLARALAKEPEKRFPSCLEFIRALSQAQGRHAPVAAPSRKRDVGQGRSSRSHPADAGTPQGHADTDKSLSMTPGLGTTGPSSARKAPPTVSALADYQFLECLGSSPLMDVWRVQSPDGRARLVKLLYGAAAGQNQALAEALLRFRLLQHPGLVPLEAVQDSPGRIVLLSDQIDDSVRDRFQQCLSRRQPGIPRDELLGYLRSAAEALDYVYQQHSVQHLGLNPRNLLLDSGRVVLADFGLAQLFWLPAGQPVAQRNTRYAAPELFTGVASRACDQYSLAVIYHEMLTGTHPHRSPGAALTTGAAPSLDKLPAGDREAVARALSPDPSQRWPSCSDFVRALAADAPEAAGAAADRFSQQLSAASGAARAGANAANEAAISPLGEVIARLVASAGGEIPANRDEDAPVLSADEGLLRHKFAAGVPLGTARLKLDALRQQWYGQAIREDDQSLVFHLSLPARFWRQWIGRQPGLEVQVTLARQNALAVTPIDVDVQIRAFRCNKARGGKLLEELGTQLLESLRASLLVNSEKRIRDRLLWPHPLRVRPLRSDGSLSEPVACRGKDISLSGIGFYLPHELPTAEVSIELPATPQTPAVAVPATLVRAKRCADGWYEVGALFRVAALRKSRPELCTA